MGKHVLAAVLAVLFMASGAQAAGNVWNDSFNKAKNDLPHLVIPLYKLVAEF